MKKKSLNFYPYFIFLLVLGIVSTNQSHADFIGCDGPCYEEYGITWQPVKFEEDGHGFKAIFPNSPKSGVMNGFYYITSHDGLTNFTIITPENTCYYPPKSLNDFIQQLEGFYSSRDKIIPLVDTNPTVMYAFELQIYNDCEELIQIKRFIYASDLKLYIIDVNGCDFSLVPTFFSHIQFLTFYNLFTDIEWD